MAEAVKVLGQGVFYTGGELLNEAEAASRFSSTEGREKTISYGILKAHNTSGDMEKLKLSFDCITSHDITYVGIIQTARASGLKRFPLPYVLTNCHNSLCAVGGTINEDDHVFGLSAAKKYGGTYVPPNLAVIHQYAREMLAECGGMILGSDSHTRYGALGTLAMGEGGPELVKQLLKSTYDIDYPGVVAIYLTGEPLPGVGPQDVALAIIRAVFDAGTVKNRIMEFIGPGVKSLSTDFRIGIDVMTTETTCLSSVWVTDEKTEEWFATHLRPGAYRELKPLEGAWYDNAVTVDLSAVRPMIAMPFHPSNAYEIEAFTADPDDILIEAEERAKEAFGDRVSLNLRDKEKNGSFRVDQGVIAGCAGGGFENLCAAADILAGADTGNGEFSLSVYPASMPVYMELVRNGAAEKLIGAGVLIKPAFCGPCFGAGDTPANNAFSIRHSTRNFPNREGSKVQEGQISAVALMDARSIAATAANKGILTSAVSFGAAPGKYRYSFDGSIYEKRVYDSKGKAEPETELVMGPNIRDWPAMPSLPEDLLLQVVSELHDPVTTTDELIPSGETSSYRSNPLRLSEFALSRRDPEYVGRAKEIQVLEKLREEDPGKLRKEAEKNAGFMTALRILEGKFGTLDLEHTGIGSTIFAVKPGDGSAREQAASCQKVLGGWANIAREYATKRYRSNLINWGMLPLLVQEEKLPFEKLDYIYLPGVREALTKGSGTFVSYVVHQGEIAEMTLRMDALTQDELQIILDGCLINYHRLDD